MSILLFSVKIVLVMEIIAMIEVFLVIKADMEDTVPRKVTIIHVGAGNLLFLLLSIGAP